MTGDPLILTYHNWGTVHQGKYDRNSDVDDDYIQCFIPYPESYFAGSCSNQGGERDRVREPAKGQYFLCWCDGVLETNQYMMPTAIPSS